MSVITTAHSSGLIVLHGTLHKNRGATLITQYKHCVDWLEHYKDALILKWAMKIHRTVDYCRSQRGANQLAK